MIAEIFGSNYHGEVKAVPSKSYAHRLLISAALSKTNSIIKNVGNSKDVLATVDCLNKLGAKITLSGGDAFVSGIESVPEKVILCAGESGSTLRFLLPIVAALNVNATFTGEGELLNRPNDALFEVLKKRGVEVSGYTLNGQLTYGRFEIDATISSQYITGLLFALPLLKGDSEIILKGKAVSSNYLDITLEILDLANVKIEKTESGYYVKGNQTYIMPDVVGCEGDWSSAAFMLVSGAFGKGVTVNGLNLNSLQGDKLVLEVLKNAGATVKCENGNVGVYGGKLKGFSVNLENAPDLAPILSVLAAGINDTSKISGISRLKIKESDRLSGILEMLKSGGVEAFSDGESITIKGGEIKSGNYLGNNDHRMVMSECILAGLSGGKSTVTDVEAVSKSYPNFFKDYEAIGGKFNV